jgi:hypothetical protein
MTEPDFNDILLRYHQTFDDSEFFEMKEKLEDMLFARTRFFQQIDSIPGNEKFNEKLEEYWRRLDDVSGEIIEPFSIFDDLRNNVKGLGTCGCCSKTGIIRHKLSVSAITEDHYIVSVCEHCFSKNIFAVNFKKKIDVDTLIPSDFSESDRIGMTAYQKKLMNN